MIQNANLIRSYNMKEEREAKKRTAPQKINKRTYARGIFAGFTLGLFIMILGLLAGWFGGQDAFAASGHASAQPFVIVGQGDTLWSIASENVKRGGDVREYIYNLQKLNGLKSSNLHEGQKLLLP